MIDCERVFAINLGLELLQYQGLQFRRYLVWQMIWNARYLLVTDRTIFLLR